MIKGDTWAVKEALDKKQLEKNIRETKKLLGSPRDVVNAKFLVRETSSLSEFANITFGERLAFLSASRLIWRL